MRPRLVEADGLWKTPRPRLPQAVLSILTEEKNRKR
jgi:hypothetical protein